MSSRLGARDASAAALACVEGRHTRPWSRPAALHRHAALRPWPEGRNGATLPGV